jgi:hypothetical protein
VWLGKIAPRIVRAVRSAVGQRINLGNGGQRQSLISVRKPPETSASWWLSSAAVKPSITSHLAASLNRNSTNRLYLHPTFTRGILWIVQSCRGRCLR